MNIYKNKTILITGASSGIGECFARTLDKFGANLIFTSSFSIYGDRSSRKIKENFEYQSFTCDNCNFPFCRSHYCTPENYITNKIYLSDELDEDAMHQFCKPCYMLMSKEQIL